MSTKVTTAIAPVIAGHHNVIDGKSDEEEWKKVCPCAKYRCGFISSLAIAWRISFLLCATSDFHHGKYWQFFSRFVSYNSLQIKFYPVTLEFREVSYSLGIWVDSHT